MRWAGIDFIEFAVDGKIERQLTSLFTYLGFNQPGALSSVGDPSASACSKHEDPAHVRTAVDIA